LEVHFDYNRYNVQRPVISTGVFDGVHKGHVEIFGRLNDVARDVKGESVVVTFWPHPRLVLKQSISLKLLNTLDEKLYLLEKSKVQHVVIVPFTEEFSKLSSEYFITSILVEKLKVYHLIVGYNHHFGKDREGTFELMHNVASRYKFTVEKLEAKIIENENVSATIIRNVLTKGDIEAARKFLGYDYMISGKIIEGNKIGKSLGFPTANVQINFDFKCIPGEGVYAVEVDLSGIRYNGMLNIGYRPTLNTHASPLSIEVHILNFSGDIYGKDITLYFKQRIRNEMKFDNLEQLKQQLEKDKVKVAKILGA
jgi:riboflavin kinase/FMN adenylyltransferase